MYRSPALLRKPASLREPNQRHSPARLLVLLPLLLMITGSARAADERIQQTRYRLVINVQFAIDTELTAGRQAAVLQQFQRLLDRSFGAMLNSQLQTDDLIFPVSREGLERLQVEPLVESWPEETWDKVLFVTFGHEQGKWVAAAREWDVQSRSLSAIAVHGTRDSRLHAEQALRAVVAVFRPVLEVDSTTRDVVTLYLKAGEYPAPDPFAEQVRVGDVLRPFFRYRDKKRVVQKIQHLPNTYVVVQKVERGLVEGVLVSGLRMTLGGGGRRRVDQMCLRERPHLPDTNVRFVLRDNPRKKLVGYRVRAFGKIRANEKTEDEPLEFMSDREGGIQLPVQPQFPVVWLYIHSGEALLARTPYVAGLETQETLELLDDSIRLSVEGELELVEGDLIDTIARRAVFMALATKLADKGDSKGVEENLERIAELPALKEYSNRIGTLRVNAIEEARRTGNRVAESRVKRLCEKIEAIVARYLAEDKMQEFREKVRQTARDASATN